MSKRKDRDIAKDLYIQSDGKIPLVDIARQLDRPPGTVRGWKSRYKWDEHLKGKDATLQNKKCNVTTSKDINKNEEKAKARAKKEILINDNLNDKQQLFCIYYLKYFNATRAYQKAYQCDYTTANVNGSRLLGNASVKEEIERLKKSRLEGIYLDSQDIVQKYIDIAFSDITDFISFGQKEFIRKTTNKEDEVIEEEVILNYVNLKDSSDIDGTVVSELSLREGDVSIKLHDKMKALDWLSKNLPKFKDEEIDLDRELMKVRIEKEKAYVSKLQKEIDTDIDKPIEISIVPRENRVGDT